jgi:flagellar biosynthetic protein FlhB
MMQDVPTADVVLTNPTHLAVALKYDPKKKSAPVVVAKGADLIAEQIKKIAKENRVPVMENKPLARALFKMVEIGDQIPGELFQAVAEILAFIYHLKNTGRQYI